MSWEDSRGSVLSLRRHQVVPLGCLTEGYVADMLKNLRSLFCGVCLCGYVHMRAGASEGQRQQIPCTWSCSHL